MNSVFALAGPLVAEVPEQFQAGVGETVAFWILAPLMVLCAIGVVLARKAVHAAVSMVGVMLCLASLYMALDAQFLGIVQIVVYTGAIMMLILFVIMMLGVTASDKYRSTATGLRVGAWVLGAIAAALLVTLVVVSFGYSTFNGIGMVADSPQADSNPVWMAKSLFSEHYFTMELVAGLLIVAAIGAMTLTHPDRMRKKMTQKEVADHKMEVYGTDRIHPGQLPQPGVYATTNAVDVPTISGETGRPIEESVPRVVRIKGLARTLGEVAPQAAKKLQEGDGKGSAMFGVEASAQVPRSGQWGMSGAPIDHALRQVTSEVAVVEPSEADPKDGKEGQA